MRLFSKRLPQGDVEAAEKAFGRLKSQVEGIRRTVLFDPDFGLYQRWYFEFRLREEVARATRYGENFALMVVSLQPTELAAEAPMVLSRAAYAVGHVVRSVDLSGYLEDGVFAICLLNCDSEGAEKAARRVEYALGSAKHTIAGVVFPDDSHDADELLRMALHRANTGAA
jgi:GGDEF domain-containing protein